MNFVLFLSTSALLFFSVFIYSCSSLRNHKHCSEVLFIPSSPSISEMYIPKKQSIISGRRNAFFMYKNIYMYFIFLIVLFLPKGFNNSSISIEFLHVHVFPHRHMYLRGGVWRPSCFSAISINLALCHGPFISVFLACPSVVP